MLTDTGLISRIQLQVYFDKLGIFDHGLEQENKSSFFGLNFYGNLEKAEFH
jgi:hypothetical protein